MLSIYLYIYIYICIYVLLYTCMSANSRCSLLEKAVHCHERVHITECANPTDKWHNGVETCTSIKINFGFHTAISSSFHFYDISSSEGNAVMGESWPWMLIGNTITNEDFYLGEVFRYCSVKQLRHWVVLNPPLCIFTHIHIEITTLSSDKYISIPITRNTSWSI